MLARLEHAWVVADGLLPPVAGDPREGVVHPLDRAFGIRDDDHIGGGFERGPEQAQLRLGPAALGQVVVNRDVVRDLAVRVLHRGDGDFGGPQAPVLPAVDHLTAPQLAAQEGSPQPLIKSEVVLSRLEQARGLAHGLGIRVSADLREGVVHPLDRALGIRNDDGIGGGGEGGMLEFQLVLGGLAPRNVADNSAVELVSADLPPGDCEFDGKLPAVFMQSRHLHGSG